MKYIKFILCGITSIILSHWLFNGSTLVTLSILGLLDSFFLLTKNKYTAHQKEKWYRITVTICICGGALIGLGNKIFNNNALRIVGAVIFIPTFSVLLVKEIIVFIKYITTK